MNDKQRRAMFAKMNNWGAIIKDKESPYERKSLILGGVGTRKEFEDSLNKKYPNHSVLLLIGTTESKERLKESLKDNSHGNWDYSWG